MGLISADKLKALFSPALTGRTTYTADEIMLSIVSSPTVDAEPVRHGEWILWNYPGEECARCSVCGEEYDQMDLYIGGNEYPKFCPNCGAKMDEVENEK